MIELGEKIKLFRRKSGLTLQKLSDLSGLSPSFISKFESGKVGISVANLDRICDCLGLNSLLLLDNIEIKMPFVSRNNERSRFHLDGNIFYEDLTPPRSTFSMISTVVFSDPGEASGEKSQHIIGDELHFVIKGSFKYIVEDQEYFLSEGDAISHHSTDSHMWKNIGDSIGLLLVVACPSIK